MAYTDINSEDRLVQATFAEHLERELGWDSVYAFNQESFGPTGTLGRSSEREAVLVRDLREALTRLNPQLPPPAIDDAVTQLTHHDFSRSLLQHNQTFHKLVRDGVPVSFCNAQGQLSHTQARVIDFRNPAHNRFLVVRELKITGLRTPNYNRRADLVCFVNGLPLVFIELKAVYKNIRAGFDGNLRDYMDENVVAHAFHHNAFLVVSNGHNARFGSITSTWEHFGEWKRLSENDVGNVAAEVLLNGMLAKDRLLDILENFILFDASKAGHTRKVAENHRFVFSLIHKFNQEVKPDAPYSERDDIIVVSDEAHRTQSGTFAKLLDVMAALDVEQQRAVQEGLSEDQLALFDLVQRGDLNKTERERIKQASRDFLAGVMAIIAPLNRWTEKEQTQAEVEIFIMDQVYLSLPEPPYTPQDKADVAQLVYQHIRQQSLRA